MNTTTSHTPTPWRVEADGLRILTDTPGKYHRVAEASDYKDANYIVAACNVHDELVAALKGLLDAARGTGNAWVAINEADSVLTKVQTC